MATEIKSTLLGMATGVVAKIFTNDIGIAVGVAFLTGGAAYLGQVFVKGVHFYVKKKLKK